MQLQAIMRDSAKSLDTLRAEGFIPAVCYGAKMPSTSIAINHGDFLKLYKSVSESKVIDLVLPTGTVQTLIHDVAVEPRTQKALHVDFLAVDANTKVKVAVPIVFIGESPAVESSMGIMNATMDELEIEAFPKDIPESIEVDISGLAAVHSSIHLSDLKLPKGVECDLEPETTIVSITALNNETEEESSTEIDFNAIEVEKKGKKEDEE